MGDLLDATALPEMTALSDRHRRCGVLLRLRARPGARDGGAAPARPLRLVLAIDRSSSMTGEKLEQARRAARILVEMLGEDDEVAIVAFDAAVRTLLAPRRATAGGKAAACIELAALTPGRGTALAEAATVALAIAREAEQSSSGARGHAILLTDGFPYTGITAPRWIERAVLESCGVATMSTVGYGEEIDGPLLAAMATAAGGRFCHVDAEGDPIAALGAELEVVRGAATSRITVTLRTPEGGGIAVLPHFAASDGRTLAARLPAATASDDVELALELVVPAGLSPGAHTIGLACVEVGPPGGAVAERIELPIRVEIAARAGALDPGVTRALCHLVAANALHHAALAEREPDELARVIAGAIGWIRGRAELAGISLRELRAILVALVSAHDLVRSEVPDAPRMAAAAEGIAKKYDSTIGTSTGMRLDSFRTLMQDLGVRTATGMSRVGREG